MIWHYITLFLIAVLGGALGGLIVHIVWSLIRDWKLRKWIDKESKWRQYALDIKWKQLTDEDIMSLIDKLHRDNKIDREMSVAETKVGTALNPIELKSNANCLTRETIERLMEEETKPKHEDEVNGEYYSTPKYLVRPSGYQFKDENGNVINATKIVLEKKKKEYPKTFRKCCEMLDIDSGCLLASYDIGLWKDELLGSLQKLLICRDAYWKLYGEEMGLGKPWEPDWTIESSKYIVLFKEAKIEKHITCKYSRVFAFPTEEMRDDFYENFKELIEFVKELL